MRYLFTLVRYDTLPPNDAHLQRIADHVSAYLQIVRSQLLATVPKAIVHCMVRNKPLGSERLGCERVLRSLVLKALHGGLRAKAVVS